MANKKQGSANICIPPLKEIKFGKLLKERRQAAKLTQEEFASMLDLTRNTVINWESDKSKPDYSYLPLICSALDIRLSELFGIESDENLSELEHRIVRSIRQLSPVSQKVVDKMVGIMVSEESLAHDKALKETYGLFLVRPGAVAAGQGDYVPDSPPAYVFLRKNTINARADGIVKVDGRSMEPVYYDGDYVYYEETRVASPGEDVIVDTDDGAVIKRMSDNYLLYSVNPDPALAYPLKNDDNNLVIRGRVLGTVRSSERPPKAEERLLEALFSDEIREFNQTYAIESWE